MSSAPSPVSDINRTRLPSLFEVLSRRSLAPVDLFSFYIYMRDQQRSVDYLDFWLDVSQHMSLCRHYVRELRRSVLIDTPDLDKSHSKRSSAVLNNIDFEDRAGPSTEKNHTRFHGDSVSRALRAEAASKHSHSNSDASAVSSNRRSGAPLSTQITPGPGRDSSSSPGNISSSPHNNVQRSDVRASAEKILYTYLLPGSEREIIVPQGILAEIQEAIEQSSRDDPEVFDPAKDYVFQAMERDAFPGFLRSKAMGNLVPPSMMLRLIIGLLALFGAFWTGFILIFLDYSRTTRCWLILPFTIGVYLLTSHQYMLDPLLGFAGFSEYTFMSFSRVREPYVRKLLIGRAMMCSAAIVAITAALCCLFILVPGKRL
ncbi:regulator of G protein signaling [Venturia nashicola]|nr:regulator of G protein signaling [Venturia nashicola]